MRASIRARQAAAAAVTAGVEGGPEALALTADREDDRQVQAGDLLRLQFTPLHETETGVGGGGEDSRSFSEPATTGGGEGEAGKERGLTDTQSQQQQQPHYLPPSDAVAADASVYSVGSATWADTGANSAAEMLRSAPLEAPALSNTFNLIGAIDSGSSISSSNSSGGGVGGEGGGMGPRRVSSSRLSGPRFRRQFRAEHLDTVAATAAASAATDDTMGGGGGGGGGGGDDLSQQLMLMPPPHSLVGGALHPSHRHDHHHNHYNNSSHHGSGVSGGGQQQHGLLRSGSSGGTYVLNGAAHTAPAAETVALPSTLAGTDGAVGITFQFSPLGSTRGATVYLPPSMEAPQATATTAAADSTAAAGAAASASAPAAPATTILVRGSSGGSILDPLADTTGGLMPPPSIYIRRQQSYFNQQPAAAQRLTAQLQHAAQFAHSPPSLLQHHHPLGGEAATVSNAAMLAAVSATTMAAAVADAAVADTSPHLRLDTDTATAAAGVANSAATVAAVNAGYLGSALRSGQAYNDVIGPDSLREAATAAAAAVDYSGGSSLSTIGGGLGPRRQQPDQLSGAVTSTAASYAASRQPVRTGSGSITRSVVPPPLLSVAAMSGPVFFAAESTPLPQYNNACNDLIALADAATITAATCSTSTASTLVSGGAGRAGDSALFPTAIVFGVDVSTHAATADIDHADAGQDFALETTADTPAAARTVAGAALAVSAGGAGHCVPEGDGEEAAEGAGSSSSSSSSRGAGVDSGSILSRSANELGLGYAGLLAGGASTSTTTTCSSTSAISAQFCSPAAAAGSNSSSSSSPEGRSGY